MLKTVFAFVKAVILNFTQISKGRSEKNAQSTISGISKNYPNISSQKDQRSTKKVALVVGHEEYRQGAIGAKGISEWIFWKAFLEENIAEFAKVCDVKIFLRDSKTSGYNAKMRQLHHRIDDWGADITISFHFNASASSKASGFEVLAYAKSDVSKKIAKIFIDEFEKNELGRNRGLKPVTRKERGGGFLAKGKSKCILVEPFFAKDQGEFMPKKAKRRALAKAISDGIAQSLNLV